MAFKRILVTIDDGDPANWAIEAAPSPSHKLHGAGGRTSCTLSRVGDGASILEVSRGI